MGAVEIRSRCCAKETCATFAFLFTFTICLQVLLCIITLWIMQMLFTTDEVEIMVLALSQT